MEERFLSYVNKTENCWEWIGGKAPNGYGIFRIDPTHQRGAHRVSYQLFKGQIPEGYVVRHMCHNRACVNPDHLQIGTQQDNENDKKAAGRQARGIKNNHCKLSEAAVLEIRASDLTQKELGNKYNISQQSISYIKRGSTWKHIL